MFKIVQKAEVNVLNNFNNFKLLCTISSYLHHSKNQNK
ncbi:MAG: hypothetical protein K0S32_1216 [Bacteroidetes bacterium]|jgi:hypothetical protein|nr:hypothetical protein [Bacteroidota bacterium]